MADEKDTMEPMADRTHGDESLVIVMRPQADATEVAGVVRRLSDAGVEAHISEGPTRTVIGAIGPAAAAATVAWEAVPGVEKTVAVLDSFRFVSRDLQAEDTVVPVAGVDVGAGSVTIIAGPCAVESREQLFAAASRVKAAGAHILRGDAFKARTSPYAFQGLGEKGLELLAEAREAFGLPFVTEVVDTRDVQLVAGYADMLRVGTRNMANYSLLSELGRQPKPVMLKRGRSASVGEWLDAAEYIYKEGNERVVLCERGIRSFESSTRNTLDLSAVPVAQSLSHLPVIVDPSHATGHAGLVRPMALAAVAAGADGIMVDVHPLPETAQVDGPQALRPDEFDDLMIELNAVAAALGRTR